MSRGLCVLVWILTACVKNGTTDSPPGEGDIRDTMSEATGTDAQPPLDISSTIQSIRGRYDLPGLGAAIVNGERIMALGTTGKRRADAPGKVGDADPWHLGSDTKAMTATLVAVQVEAGVLSWDTEVVEVFPSANDGWLGVTIEDLLQHQGGASDSLPGDRPELWTGLWEDSDSRRARLDAVTALVTSAPDEPVGAFAYSNAGYMIAGAMLEELLDTPWEELMRDRLFSPLGMDNCGFGPPEGAVPWGHSASGTSIEPGPGADNPPGLGPAGTVHCSLEDWARFISLHLRRTSEQDPELSRSAFDRMHASRDGYGHGWAVFEDGGNGITLSHAGSNTLWLATAWLAPERDRGFLAVSNIASPGAQEAHNEVAIALLDLEPQL